MFDNFKFDPAEAASATAAVIAGMAGRGVQDAPLSVFLEVIARRLKQDPHSYTDYGPYWWAVKALLNANGYSYGQQDDPLVRAEYTHDDPNVVCWMANEFRDYVRQDAMLPKYHSQFELVGGDVWLLVDEDMEGRAPG